MYQEVREGTTRTCPWWNSVGTHWDGWLQLGVVLLLFWQRCRQNKSAATPPSAKPPGYLGVPAVKSRARDETTTGDLHHRHAGFWVGRGDALLIGRRPLDRLATCGSRLWPAYISMLDSAVKSGKRVGGVGALCKLGVQHLKDHGRPYPKLQKEICWCNHELVWHCNHAFGKTEHVKWSF